jgi:hypothetical protein
MLADNGERERAAELIKSLPSIGGDDGPARTSEVEVVDSGEVTDFYARATEFYRRLEGRLFSPGPDRTAAMAHALGSILETELRDRYAVERELGEGGMALVWHATDVRHHRAVALKVLAAGVEGAGACWRD